MTVRCCSSNPGKLREFALASPVIQPLPGLKSVQPPEETGSTFEENAAIKALYYARFTSDLVFADDSGLEVDALGGEPGVYSARYAGEGASDAANNELLLNRLRGEANRHARFVCAIALAHQGAVINSFRGTVQGEILEAPQGDGGFGYDPLFYHRPSRCTLAELSPEAKWRVSHRGQAVRALLSFLSL